MSHLITRAASTAAAILLVAGALTGCQQARTDERFCGRNSTADNAPTTVTHHTILVVGNVANAAKPILTAGMKAVLTSTWMAGGRVDLVSTAGNGLLCPAEQLGLDTIAEDINEAGKEAIARSNWRALLTEAQRPPRDSGSDAYAALSLAEGQLASIGAEHRAVIFLGSGLNDHGLLDMTAPGALGAEPSETVALLTSQHSLLNLHGATVLLAGLGYSAPPQKPLSLSARRQVVATYASVLKASNAEVVVDEAPSTGDPLDTLGSTVTPTPIALPKEPPSPCRPTVEVFDQTSALRFVASKAVLADSNAAAEALRPLSAWLAEDRDRTVAILGTTARTGTRAGQEQVGLARGRVVAEMLRDQGVSAKQIVSITSHGSYFTGYVDDHASGGGLSPSAAALNRSVRLTLSSSC